jgi:CubicO group peptidase (beta-lactamase class C family)
MLSSCYIGRFFYWNFADINDYKKFKFLDVKKPDVPFTFIKNSTIKSIDSISYNGIKYKLDDFVESNKSVAFLIIRNDTMLYEKYFQGRNQGSYVPSFSAAKSFVSALVGIAIGEGSIKSVNQPITDFLPELKLNDERFSKITIENLLNMRSGILFKESYFNPFGNVAKSYYGRNLIGQLKTLKIKSEPDKEFEYVSENTQLLAFIVERATGKKIPEYLQEKIWKPLGMEYDATWSTDSKERKEAKAFCCLNACARDYAKFGRLYLNNGKWNGQQVVPAAWVKKSTTVDQSTKDLFYSYQWWHNTEWIRLTDTTKTSPTDSLHIEYATSKDGKKAKYLSTPLHDFFADGFLGQFIYVYPSKNIIIVRLGKAAKVRWQRIFLSIAQQL